MPKFAFSWEPTGQNLDAYKLTRVTDGDTPFIEMSIRMLSIDTPEIHYPGTAKPSNSDSLLMKLAARLRAKEFPGLSTTLRHRLISCLDGQAGTRQEQQGIKATEQFQRILEQRMSAGRKRRRLFVRTADEIFDDNGRLLAYIAPSYTKEERATMTLYDRRTFNLQLIEEGWAAPFLIYPSLPKQEDLTLFWQCAHAARIGKRGNNADLKGLTGYEFRMCVKMARGEAKGPERYCADLRSGKIYRPEDYLEVLPEDRIFIWARDVSGAIRKLRLTRTY